MFWTPHELQNQVILCLDESSNMLAMCDKVKLNLNHCWVGDILVFIMEGVSGSVVTISPGLVVTLLQLTPPCYKQPRPVTTNPDMLQ